MSTDKQRVIKQATQIATLHTALRHAKEALEEANLLPEESELRVEIETALNAGE